MLRQTYLAHNVLEWNQIMVLFIPEEYLKCLQKWPFLATFNVTLILNSQCHSVFYFLTFLHEIFVMTFIK